MHISEMQGHPTVGVCTCERVYVRVSCVGHTFAAAVRVCVCKCDRKYLVSACCRTSVAAVSSVALQAPLSSLEILSGGCERSSLLCPFRSVGGVRGVTGL